METTPSLVGGTAAEPQRRTTTGSIDGRSLRRERNRDAVIVALLQLIREGVHAPATEQIAERAGVSHRSVFRYFDDLDDLVRAAIAHEIAEVLPHATLPDIGDGAVEQRVDSLIETMLSVYDYTSHIGRVARARALDIPAIDDELRGVLHLIRSQIATHFAKELAPLDDTSADDLLDSVLLTVSFESYDVSHRRLGRSVDDIRRRWRSALLALLAT